MSGLHINESHVSKWWNSKLQIDEEFEDENLEITEDHNNHDSAKDDAIDRYMYNFWDTTFRLDIGEWKGEDLAFCERAKNAGFKIYANLDSWTTHHGSYGWKGRFGDYFVNKKAK